MTYLNINDTSDTISHETIARLGHTWLDHHAQTGVINDSILNREEVSVVKPHGFAPSLALFNVFINDAGGGMECALRKCVDDTKLRVVADLLEDQIQIQHDLDTLRKPS